MSTINETTMQKPTLARGEHVHNNPDTMDMNNWADTKKKKKWVEVKRNHPDHIVFMHIGGFFEFFHQDADVVNHVCDAVYMKGEVAHTGIPETVFQSIEEKLKGAGYDKISII